MLRLFERYELPDNMRTMLKALDEFKTSKLDEASLGRMIRLSPNNRAALVSTMVKWYGFYMSSCMRVHTDHTLVQTS